MQYLVPETLYVLLYHLAKFFYFEIIFHGFLVLM